MFNSGLRTRLEQLEDRVREMEEAHRRVVELEADWQDWLHKIKNVLARLNQRANREEEVAPRGARPINPAAARLLNGGQ